MRGKIAPSPEIWQTGTCQSSQKYLHLLFHFTSVDRNCFTTDSSALVSQMQQVFCFGSEGFPGSSSEATSLVGKNKFSAVLHKVGVASGEVGLESVPDPALTGWKHSLSMANEAQICHEVQITEWN